jgi:hypothetical protein
MSDPKGLYLGGPVRRHYCKKKTPAVCDTAGATPKEA